MFACFRALCLAASGLLLTGCLSVPNVINYATAEAMDYSRLASDARKRDPQLSSLIKRISESPEHQRMQRVLADLPSDMTACLVIETAEMDEKDFAPSILAMFVSAESVGFLSNFAFDENGASAPLLGEWRAAVWPAPDDADSLLPDDPASLLNSSQVQEATPRQTAAIILTLVTHEQTLTLALWDDGALTMPQERLAKYLPKRLPAAIRAGISRNGL